MCGIAGLWGVEAPHALGAVERMLYAMAHRGPDGRGTLTFNGGAAGMVRLALVDPTPRGDQPMWSPDGLVAILFNGEVYNFRTERARLESSGYRFKTTTDTEVVLALYLEDPERFVHRLRGMFAVAIFDRRESGPHGPPVVTLVRDQFGIKPLYVFEDGGRVAFSSELRAFVRAGIAPATIDRHGLRDYLAFGFVPGPRTMIESVRHVEAGTIERYTPGRPSRVERWFEIPPAEPRNVGLREAAQELRGVLEESIALHSFADVPVGAFLSGGVDSTGIVALMRPHVEKLRTYSIRFPDVPGGDESEEASEAAAAMGCEHTTVDVTDDDAAKLVEEFGRALDQPSVDGFNTWLISRTAAREVKGVLSGLGGDELFAGYPVTRRMARRRSTLAGRLEGLAGSAAHRSGMRRTVARRLSPRRSQVALWTQAHAVFDWETANIAAGVAAGEGSAADAVDERIDLAGESPVGVSLRLDTSVYMGQQLLRDSDSTSMSHSLELRVPFVDVEVMKFSRRCPDELKLKPSGGTGSTYAESGSKLVLIEALREVLPADIATRPKRGFALPYARWMAGPLSGVGADAVRALGGRGVLAQIPGAHWPYPDTWSLMVLGTLLATLGGTASR